MNNHPFVYRYRWLFNFSNVIEAANHLYCKIFNKRKNPFEEVFNYPGFDGYDHRKLICYWDVNLVLLSVIWGTYIDKEGLSCLDYPLDQDTVDYIAKYHRCVSNVLEDLLEGNNLEDMLISDDLASVEVEGNGLYCYRDLDGHVIDFVYNISSDQVYYIAIMVQCYLAEFKAAFPLRNIEDYYIEVTDVEGMEIIKGCSPNINNFFDLLNDMHKTFCIQYNLELN